MLCINRFKEAARHALRGEQRECLKALLMAGVAIKFASKTELKLCFGFMQAFEGIPWVRSSPDWRRVAQAYKARCLKVFSAK